MAKALLISRKSSNFNNRAQSQGKKEALLFSTPADPPGLGVGVALHRVGTSGPLFEEAAEVAPGAQGRRCSWRNAPAEVLRRCQCEDEPDGHLGGFSLHQSSRSCLGKESPARGRSLQRFWCQLGQKQLQVGTGSRSVGAAQNLGTPSCSTSINPCPIFPPQNTFCLSLQPPSFASSKLLASGKLW